MNMKTDGEMAEQYADFYGQLLLDREQYIDYIYFDTKLIFEGQQEARFEI